MCTCVWYWQRRLASDCRAGASSGETSSVSGEESAPRSAGCSRINSAPAPFAIRSSCAVRRTSSFACASSRACAVGTFGNPRTLSRSSRTGGGPPSGESGVEKKRDTENVEHGSKAKMAAVNEYVVCFASAVRRTVVDTVGRHAVARLSALGMMLSRRVGREARKKGATRGVRCLWQKVAMQELGGETQAWRGQQSSAMAAANPGVVPRRCLMGRGHHDTIGARHPDVICAGRPYTATQIGADPSS
eukprot:4081471-Pleurochrysis_carterae.AAC.5